MALNATARRITPTTTSPTRSHVCLSDSLLKKSPMALMPCSGFGREPAPGGNTMCLPPGLFFFQMHAYAWASAWVGNPAYTTAGPRDGPGRELLCTIVYVVLLTHHSPVSFEPEPGPGPQGFVAGEVLAGLPAATNNTPLTLRVPLHGF